VLSELVAEAARQDARDRALEELGAGVEVPEHAVARWLKKLAQLPQFGGPKDFFGGSPDVRRLTPHGVEVARSSEVLGEGVACAGALGIDRSPNDVV